MDSYKGKVIWSEIKFNEKWWLGLEGIFGDFAIFHFYARPDLPQHKKIICVDIDKGKIVWENNEFVFSMFDGNELICNQMTFEKVAYYKIKLNTGEIVEEIEQSDFKNLKRTIIESNFLTPLVITKEQENISEKFFNENKKFIINLDGKILFRELLNKGGNISVTPKFFIKDKNIL